MESIIKEITPALTVAVLTGLGGIIWKLIMILKPIEEFMKKTADKLEEHEDRLDVHDNAWTLKSRKSFNSKMIAKGHMDLPEV